MEWVYYTSRLGQVDPLPPLHQAAAGEVVVDDSVRDSDGVPVDLSATQRAEKKLLEDVEEKVAFELINMKGDDILPTGKGTGAAC